MKKLTLNLITINLAVQECIRRSFRLKVVAKLEIIRQLQMAKLLGDIEKIRIGEITIIY